ncbi:MAG: hypothetical protein WBF93_09375, partial [Pirellulales bacterium]
LYLYHVPTRQLVTQFVDESLKQRSGFEQSSSAHLDLVQSVAAHPNGRRFATGGYRTVKIWRQQPIRIEREFAGVRHTITSLVASRDGSMAAACQSNGKILLLSLRDGEVLHTLEGHVGSVFDSMFSKDGRRLVTVGADKTVRLFSTDDGSTVTMFNSATTPTAVALIDREQRIAVSDIEGSVSIWEIASAEAKEPSVAKSAGGPVASLLAVGGQQQQFVTLGKEGTIQIWDATTFKPVRQIKFDAPIVAARSSSAGDTFIVLGANRTAKVFNGNDGSLLAETEVDVESRRRVAEAKLDLEVARRVFAGAQGDHDDTKRRLESAEKASEKSKRVAATAETDLQNVTKATADAVANEAAAAKRFQSAQEVLQAAESAAQTAAAAAGQAEELVGKTEALLEATENKAAAQSALDDAKSRRETAQSVQQAADRSVHLAGQHLKNLEDERKPLIEILRKARLAQKLSELNGHSAQKNVLRTQAEFLHLTEENHEASQILVQKENEFKMAQARHIELTTATDKLDVRQFQIALSADGSRFAVADEQGKIATFTVEGTPVDVATTNQTTPFVGLAWLPNGQLLTATDEPTIRTWRFGSWELERTIGGPESDLFADRVTALDFSPDGKILATGGGEASRQGELKLWSVASGELLQVIEKPHSDTIVDIDFSYDGRYLASCGTDRFMKVFDTANGEMLNSFEGHTGYVLGVSWRADGRMLATCGADKAIKVWDFVSGNQHRTIDGFRKELTAIRFIGSSDEFVVSGGNKEVVTRSTNGSTGPGFGGVADFVHTVSASASGNVIVAGGEDGVLRVWQRDGKAIAVFEPPVVAEDTGAANTSVTN